MVHMAVRMERKPTRLLIPKPRLCPYLFSIFYSKQLGKRSLTMEAVGHIGLTRAGCLMQPSQAYLPSAANSPDNPQEGGVIGSPERSGSSAPRVSSSCTRVWMPNAACFSCWRGWSSGSTAYSGISAFSVTGPSLAVPSQRPASSWLWELEV